MDSLDTKLKGFCEIFYSMIGLKLKIMKVPFFYYGFHKKTSGFFKSGKDDILHVASYSLRTKAAHWLTDLI